MAEDYSTKLKAVLVNKPANSPVFVKQYTILLMYQNFIDDETKRLEEAGLISSSLSNWSTPCMVMPKKQVSNKPNEIQLRIVTKGF